MPDDAHALLEDLTYAAMKATRTLVLPYFLLLALCLGLGALLGLQTPALARQTQGLDPTRAITQYMHEVWDTDDGLPQSSINAIAQTRDGYLWFGTYEGLARFDGIQFTVFNTQNTEAFAGNVIHALHEAQDGSLWIGTQNAGVIRYKEGVFTSYSTHNGLPHAFVRALTEDRHGRLWIGTDGGGLTLFENDTFITYTTDEGLPTNAINALLADARGNLWIGTHGGGLVRYNDDTFTTYTMDDGLSNNFVWSLHEDHTGTLWIGTRGGGLNTFRYGSFKAYTEAEGLAHDQINAIYEDRNNTLWVGTYGGGLYRYFDGQFAAFTTSNGLSDDMIWSLHEDFEGSLWIGTLSGGLNRLKNTKITAFGKPEGLSNDITRAIYEDQHGTLWVGTMGGGLNRIQDRHVTTYTTDNGLSDNYVWAIHEDHAGALWIGTQEGLNRLHEGVLTVFTADDGLPNDFIRTITSSPDGSLWLGTNGGGLVQYKDSTFTTYTTDDGLPHNVVRILLVDRRGVLWIGTRGGGLARFKGGVFTTFTTDNGLSHGSVTALHEDETGVLWIGTYGGGLIRLKDEVFTIYTSRDGLFDDVIHHILEDHQGYLWVSSNKGIAQISKNELNDFAAGSIATITSTSYGKADGMRTIECNGASPGGWRSSDGSLWFPTVRGVVAMNPHQEASNVLPPPVYIEKVVANGTPVNLLNDAITLSPGLERIELHYAGLSYLNPDRVRFKFKLEGYDDDWVDAGSRRTAFYTNLSPGTYTFRVIAANDDGLWNDIGAARSFYIQPFFYQTLWFFLLLALSAVGTALGLYRLRIRQLTHHTEMLEHAVEERTRAFQQQAEEILRQKEEADKARKTAEQAHEVKTQLMNIAAHDMKNPLSGIKGFATMIQNNLVEGPRLIESAEMIIDASNRMLHLVTELLDSASLESNGLMLHKQRIDLRTLAHEVIKHNTNLAEQKGQALVFSETPNSTTFVEADPDRMRDVMENLVSNAIKYSPVGKTISVELQTTGQEVLFAVRDKGPGLSKADQEHLFKPFRRLSPQPTGGESSTGLGLSIAKKLVDLHEGSIEVQSLLGRGTTFTVILPAYPQCDRPLSTPKHRFPA